MIDYVIILAAVIVTALIIIYKLKHKGCGHNCDKCNKNCGK